MLGGLGGGASHSGLTRREEERLESEVEEVMVVLLSLVAFVQGFSRLRNTEHLARLLVHGEGELSNEDPSMLSASRTRLMTARSWFLRPLVPHSAPQSSPHL